MHCKCPNVQIDENSSIYQVITQIVDWTIHTPPGSEGRKAPTAHFQGCPGRRPGRWTGKDREGQWGRVEIVALLLNRPAPEANTTSALVLGENGNHPSRRHHSSFNLFPGMHCKCPNVQIRVYLAEIMDIYKA